MIHPNRKEIRKQFATLLSAALVGAGAPAQAVYGFRKGDIKGQTPLVVVSSAGTKRTDLTFMGTVPSHRLQVDIFVLYADEKSGWTEELAEDRLDELELGIAEVIAANKVSATFWEGITETDWSERLDVVIGGVDYIREYLVLEFS